MRKEDHDVDFFHAIKAGPKVFFNWSIHLVASLLHEFNFLISVMDYDFCTILVNRLSNQYGHHMNYCPL